MTIQDFVIKAERKAAEHFESIGAGRITTDSVEVVKANDERLHGLRLAREGELAGWNVYLDDLYEKYRDGEDLDGLLREAALRCEEGLGFRAPLSPDALKLDFDSIRDRLSVRLLGIENNMSYMNGKPYIDTGCGLAMVAVIGCDGDPPGEWFVSVTNDLLRTEIRAGGEELLTAAFANTIENEPPVLVSLEDHIHASCVDSIHVQNYLKDPVIDEYRKHRALMLSNGSMFFGAAALFYPGVKERITDILGCGYYVLPSSVHELMIISEEAEPDVQAMAETVIEANRTVVDRSEVLSDQVLYYDPESGKLSVVTGQSKCDNDCRRFSA